MSAVIWHDVECGSYAADLKLWEELAAKAEGPVLDLGCGTGRVALHLARRGHRVVGLDSNAALLAALEKRANGLPVETALGDARDFELDEEFGLVLAPMQLAQLLASAGARVECLRRVRRHLQHGGLAACAVLNPVETLFPPMGEIKRFDRVVPDAREVDGWVYSSLPLDIALTPDAVRVRRLRQTVSPAGRLEEEIDVVELRLFPLAALEVDAAEAGLRPAGRRSIPPTEDHVGSTVVLLEAP